MPSFMDITGLTYKHLSPYARVVTKISSCPEVYVVSNKGIEQLGCSFGFIFLFKGGEFLEAFMLGLEVSVYGSFKSDIFARKSFRIQLNNLSII